MISGLEYMIKDGRAYLGRIREGGTDSLTVSVTGLNDGWLTLGGINYRISHGSASVPIPPLPDGIYGASLNTPDGRVELIPIRVEHGVVSLNIDSRQLLRIERELYNLALITADLSELVISLDEAVFGSKIF